MMLERSPASRRAYQQPREGTRTRQALQHIFVGPKPTACGTRSEADQCSDQDLRKARRWSDCDSFARLGAALSKQELHHRALSTELIGSLLFGCAASFWCFTPNCKTYKRPTVLKSPLYKHDPGSTARQSNLTVRDKQV